MVSHLSRPLADSRDRCGRRPGQGGGGSLRSGRQV